MNSMEYKREICGQDKREYVQILSTVCEDCYHRDIEWVIRQAAKEENNILDMTVEAPPTVDVDNGIG